MQIKKASFIGLTAAVFFLSLALSATAQSSDLEENKEIVSKNALRLNWLPQLSYDRILWQKGNHHIGATVGTFVFCDNRDYAFGQVKKQLWSSFSTLGAYYLYGKKNHYFETSLQYGLLQHQNLDGSWAAGQNTVNGYRASSGTLGTERRIDEAEVQRLREQSKDFIIDNTTVGNSLENWTTARMGYRYQGSDGGLLFRAGFGFFNRIGAGNSGNQSKTYWGAVRSDAGSNSSDVWLLNLDLSLGWSF